MQAPSVTVVIPLYNKRAYIERSLRSVRAQGVGDCEIVVVDDGSTDGGGEVAAGLLTEGDQLIAQENSGVSAARNTGIDAARSDFIAFLDADDRWLPGHLQNLLKLRELFPDAGLYATGLRRQMPDGLCIETCVEGDRPVLLDGFASRRRIGLVSASSVGFAKDTVDAIGLFPEGVALGEDVDFFNRACIAGPLACHPDVTAVYYYQTVGSASQRHAGRVSWTDAVLEPLQQRLDAGEVPEEAREGVIEYLAHQRLLRLPLGDREKALGFLAYPYMTRPGLRGRALAWRFVLACLPASLRRLLAKARNSRWNLRPVMRDGGAIQRVYRLDAAEQDAEEGSSE